MPLIGLVGHCGPDSYMLRSAVKYAAREAEVRMINDESALDAALEQGADLLLINRVLDGGFTHHEGTGLIGAIKARGATARLMLISNYPDAQRAAEAAGAMPGFGKSEIGTSKMRDALTRALAGSDAGVSGSRT
jgi:hypothetical protein